MIQWLKSSNQPEISKYIECYWFIEKTIESNTFQYPLLYPDASVHLIISPSNQYYHYDMNPGVSTGKGSHWLYAHRKTLHLDHSNPFVHLGVKFRIGALYSLGDIVNREPILDKVELASLDMLFKKSYLNKNELIELARSDSDQCCKVMDNLISPLFSDIREDQHSRLTYKSIQLINSTRISELSNLLNCSQRRLERSFNRVTGFTLKQYQSIQRLEMILEFLYQRDVNDIDWVEIAFKFGFSDQPHFIRYLKKQLGKTPKAYEKERVLTIDVYGGIDL